MVTTTQHHGRSAVIVGCRDLTVIHAAVAVCSTCTVQYLSQRLQFVIPDHSKVMTTSLSTVESFKLRV